MKKEVMDIKAFLQCKKPRRSYRLEVKEREETKTKVIRQHPLGYFDVLPIELKFQILQNLTVEELSILTITSKSMRNLIEGFRVLTPVMQKELLYRIHGSSDCPLISYEKQSDYLRTFQRLGLLMKRSTCLYSTKDRLKFVNDFLTKMMCCNADHCQNLSRCIAMNCFGKFLHTVISGWDDSECQKVYDVICHHSGILKNVKLVVNSKPGSHNRMECEIRIFFRRVFLDHCCSVQERAFWLSRILKQWPMVQQARILFLLFGPNLDDDILWYEVCENTPANSEQSTTHFADLANALQILHSYPQEWTEDDIISVLDELTSLPDEWLAENVAHLLILCGDVITSKLLVSKAINGRIIELSSITTSFSVVCVKNGFSQSYVITMIKHILEAFDNCKDRQQFFNSVMDMFKELILDMHEFSDPEDGHENDMYYLITALTEFTKKMIQLGFKQFLTC